MRDSFAWTFCNEGNNSEHHGLKLRLAPFKSVVSNQLLLKEGWSLGKDSFARKYNTKQRVLPYKNGRPSGVPLCHGEDIHAYRSG